jgi:hypothetical protein
LLDFQSVGEAAVSTMANGALIGRAKPQYRKMSVGRRHFFAKPIQIAPM